METHELGNEDTGDTQGGWMEYYNGDGDCIVAAEGRYVERKAHGRWMGCPANGSCHRWRYSRDEKVDQPQIP